MNLTKYVENLYSENYTMLMKEIKDPKKMDKHTVFMDWNNQHSKHYQFSPN